MGRNTERGVSKGDYYIGKIRRLIGDRKGKHIWPDGTIYNGEWHEGKRTGKGHITWPSGATYTGEFFEGQLHGYGTFTLPDGSMYKGDWKVNVPHGNGRRVYVKSDISENRTRKHDANNTEVYEGTFKNGKPEGNGRYCWRTETVYVGKFKNGKRFGRGVWRHNGDIYDGFWFNDWRHGYGVYRFANGGFYFGEWKMEVSHGKGILYPPGSQHPCLKKWLHSNSDRWKILESSDFYLLKQKDHKRSVSDELGGVLRSLGFMSVAQDSPLCSNCILGDPAQDFKYQSSLSAVNCLADEGQWHTRNESAVVYEREYEQGVLIKEVKRKYAICFPLR